MPARLKRGERVQEVVSDPLVEDRADRRAGDQPRPLACQIYARHDMGRARAYLEKTPAEKALAEPPRCPIAATAFRTKHTHTHTPTLIHTYIK